ncbi:response regulator [Salinimicrobium flavum]|uniref:Response regulator n=1 Tax=Salinimicrobium flavum TaxID=1737065 RepID=A0ABW5IWB0_9FLAO
MRKLIKLSFILSLPLLMSSCGEGEERNETVDSTDETVMTDQTTQMEADITLTQAERDALMPADVVAEFQEGNLRYVKDSLTPRNRQARRGATVFLLDIMLPDGNGLDLCRELKNNETTRKIPVVLMSAHADINSMEGADDFISKPFDVDELLRRIERQLG